VIRALLAMLLLAGAWAGDAPAPAIVAPPGGGVVADPAQPVGGVVGAVEGKTPAAPTEAVPGSGAVVQSATGVVPTPGQLSISFNGQGQQGLSAAVQLLLVITVLAVAPAFLMMMTCFTRVIIVLGFVRRALGTQTLPPNQVVVGLALFLSLFIMSPTIKRIETEAWTPWQKQEISQEQALQNATQAAKDFMLKHTRKGDLALFIKLAKEERPKSAADVSFLTLVPAFVTSELKTAFQMGFVIFLPFLVIDLVISAILMSLGMMMLPPVVVSLPFKILLFVLVDGWVLIIQGLAASYA
jgi:flagellar biosynthetic protein FliP